MTKRTKAASGPTPREELRDPKTHARAATAIRNIGRLIGDDMGELEEIVATRGFHFGALVPKLSEQLAGELPGSELKWLDKYAAAVTLLSLQSLLSEAETHNARKRIVRRIEQLMREHARGQP